MGAPNPIRFDTPYLVERPNAAGMPAGQAETITHEQAIVFNDERMTSAS